MNKIERDERLAQLYRMGADYDHITKALDAVRALDPHRLTEERDESIASQLRVMVIRAGKIGRLMKASNDALNTEIRTLETMRFDDAGEHVDAAAQAKLILDLDMLRWAPVDEEPRFATLVALGLARATDIYGVQAYALSFAGAEECRRLHETERLASAAEVSQ